MILDDAIQMIGREAVGSGVITDLPVIGLGIGLNVKEK